MKLRLRRIGLLVCLVIGLGALTAPASAHPLGNFTVNRYTGIVVGSDGVTLDHVIDFAEVPTAQLGDAVKDLDALAASRCRGAAAAMRLSVGGSPTTLRVDRSSASTAPGQAELPVTRIVCEMTADADIADEATAVSFVDRSAPAQVGWREVTAVGDEMTLAASDVPQTSVSDRLTRYPSDLLSSPLDVSSADLSVTPGGPALVEATGSSDSAAATPGSWLAERADQLLARNGLWAGLLALLVALVLGASHALAPGHGKTVMAFYLTQGTDNARRSAAAVATSVTLTHTGSVLAFALLVSVSTQFVPARLYPWLTLLTGVLILVLGLSLLRRAVRRGSATGHGHGHGHAHGHGHGHGAGAGQHDHGHGDHDHAHSHPTHPRDERPLVVAAAPGMPAPSAGTVLAPPLPAPSAPAAGPAAHFPRVVLPPAGGRWEPWTMGVVGGLLPSPSALLLMLAAVAIGKAWFGGLLVLAFGIGMACTLAAAGLLAHDLVARLERLAARTGRLSGAVTSLVGRTAALGVCLIGAGVVVRTLIGMR